MPTTLPSAFTQIDLDSGALAGSANVVHRLNEVGDWLLNVCRKEAVVLATIRLRVREDGTQLSASVDLSAAEIAGSTRYLGDPTLELTVRKGAYLRLHASSGQAGLFAVLRSAKDESVVWDSRQLVSSDLFVFLPLRPGHYLLANLITPAECGIAVLYPDPRDSIGKRLKNPDSMHLKVGTNFPVKTMNLMPGQGVILDTRGPARFTFVLQTPDNGPLDLADWRKAQDQKAWATLLAKHRQ